MTDLVKVGAKVSEYSMTTDQLQRIGTVVEVSDTKIKVSYRTKHQEEFVTYSILTTTDGSHTVVVNGKISYLEQYQPGHSFELRFNNLVDFLHNFPYEDLTLAELNTLYSTVRKLIPKKKNDDD